MFYKRGSFKGQKRLTAGCGGCPSRIVHMCDFRSRYEQLARTLLVPPTNHVL